MMCRSRFRSFPCTVCTAKQLLKTSHAAQFSLPAACPQRSHQMNEFRICGTRPLFHRLRTAPETPSQDQEYRPQSGGHFCLTILTQAHTRNGYSSAQTQEEESSCILKSNGAPRFILQMKSPITVALQSDLNDVTVFPSFLAEQGQTRSLGIIQAQLLHFLTARAALLAASTYSHEIRACRRTWKGAFGASFYGGPRCAPPFPPDTIAQRKGSSLTH